MSIFAVHGLPLPNGFTCEGGLKFQRCYLADHRYREGNIGTRPLSSASPTARVARILPLGVLRFGWLNGQQLLTPYSRELCLTWPEQKTPKANAVAQAALLPSSSVGSC